MNEAAHDIFYAGGTAVETASLALIRDEVARLIGPHKLSIEGETSDVDARFSFQAFGSSSLSHQYLGTHGGTGSA
jgi:hypothetical protein